MKSLMEDREFQVSVLVVDDQKESRKLARISCQTQFSAVKNTELNIEEAATISSALNLLSSQNFHVVLLDKDLGTDSNGKPINGLDYIQEILAIQPLTQVIMLTADKSFKDIAVAMKRGASDYLLKSSDSEVKEYREAVIAQALQRAKNKLYQARREKQVSTDLYSDFVCKSPSMQRLYCKLEALSETNRPVLITGATGLGKGASARQLHTLRKQFLSQKERPFFNVNIGAMPDDLAQGELFGHEPNSFTGSGDKTKPGYLELASGGDLFLDEIGDTSPDMQLKLLKVIEEKEFLRIGGRKPIKTTARFIFATNKNLLEMVEKGQFREDLYRRISAFEIEMPSLEERKEDLPEMIRVILQKIGKEHPSRQISLKQLPSDLLKHLTRSNIPGNIRGLENDLMRLTLFSQKSNDGSLNLSHWKSILGFQSSARKQKNGQNIITLTDLMESNFDLLGPGFPGYHVVKKLFEQKLLEEAIQKHPRVIDCAHALGIGSAYTSIKLRDIRKVKRNKTIRKEVSGHV